MSNQVLHLDKSISYLKDGKLHREDGPALVWKNGKYFKYYINGILHREDGPALVSKHITEYRINGILHREDGPAFIKRKDDILIEKWYLNGKIHRQLNDGPAILFKNKDKVIYQEWTEYGVSFKKENAKLLYDPINCFYCGHLNYLENWQKIPVEKNGFTILLKDLNRCKKEIYFKHKILDYVKSNNIYSYPSWVTTNYWMYPFKCSKCSCSITSPYLNYKDSNIYIMELFSKDKTNSIQIHKSKEIIGRGLNKTTDPDKEQVDIRLYINSRQKNTINKKLYIKEDQLFIENFIKILYSNNGFSKAALVLSEYVST